MQNKLSQALYFVGGTLTIAGALAVFFQVEYAKYIFSAGAALIIYLQTVHALNLRNADTRKQRLARIGFLSSLLLALAAYFMFTHSNSWVVAVLIYALVSLFLSFRDK